MAKKGKKAETGGVEFFLRFYGATTQQIDTCLEELKPYMADVLSVSRKPLTQSCNAVVRTNDNTEVTFVFASMAACDEFKYTTATRDIYMKYASPKIEGDFVVRSRGDMAFEQ